MKPDIKVRLPKLHFDSVVKGEFGLGKNKKLYIIFGIAILIILFVGCFLIYRNAVNNQTEPISEDKPITALTPQAIARLQSYSYIDNTPIAKCEDLITKQPDVPKWIIDTFFSKIIKVKDNEKYFTDVTLTYITREYNFALRYVYQVKQADGSIDERDMEYQFKFGKWNDDHSDVEIISVRSRVLGGQKIIRGDGM